jgi:hypothetical protein
LVERQAIHPNDSEPEKHQKKRNGRLIPLEKRNRKKQKIDTCKHPERISKKKADIGKASDGFALED